MARMRTAPTLFRIYDAAEGVYTAAILRAWDGPSTERSGNEWDRRSS